MSAKLREGEEIGGGGGGDWMNGEKGAEAGPALPREQREAIRRSMVKRKKDFMCMERVKGRMVNVLQGLELHTGVFSVAEQQRIVDYVYELQEKGRNRELRERTYSEPRKWMRGKGRVTMQFGCCYNYAIDKDGNPPGIIRDEEVDPIPPLLKTMIKRMVAWSVLPPTCIPNSCIINIYDVDDCIPPHIDHHDFVRPFCTVSFLSECNILFGASLKVLGPGDFSGSTAIPLPVGSVLILKGNGADVAKHCVPAVPSKRISITFRKMDDSKLPFRFAIDPELRNLQPLPYPAKGSPAQQIGNHVSASPTQHQSQHQVTPSPGHKTSSHLSSESSEDHSSSENSQSASSGEKNSNPSPFAQDDFPSLVSPVTQHRSQQHSTPSQTPQTSSYPGNWNSRVRNTSIDPSQSKRSPASAEIPRSQSQFGQDDFPSLGSGSFNKPLRKPGRSLRQ